jgi:branched-chain amino acid transport system ATP-binding protein
VVEPAPTSAAPATPVLEVDGLTKTFGLLFALRYVSFQVGGGEIVGLIGPNGAGKTTLVNVVAGSAPGWSGDVRFQGRSIRGLAPSRIAHHGIARTFQVAQPFAQMTVAENVMVGVLFGRDDSPRRPRAARREAAELLASVRLEEKAELPAESLNAPERKRLEIAKALAIEPRLLLLDEVMAGLNPAEVDDAVELIMRVRDRGVTILLIEHVMQAVASLCDRVVVLHHGEKLAEGAPAAVFADPTVIDAYLGATPLDRPA